MKKLAILIIIMHYALSIAHAQTTLPQDVANEFGNLLVYHNNRICPLQTLARDYTIKLTGKTSYKNFTAEQIFSGYFFYYNEWCNEPIIKIKGKDAQQTLNIKGKYASFNDFHSPQGYKLIGNRGKNFSAADEKYNLIMMNLTGSLLKIFPYKATEHIDSNKNQESIKWFALNDNLPEDMSQAEQLFIRKSMNLLAEYITNAQYTEAIDLIRKIRKYQETQLGTFAPSEAHIRAERIYNHLNLNRPLAIALMLMGILLFIIALIKAQTPRWTWIILTLTAIYLLFSISLRGYIAGHFPLSNGFETMQFLALIVILLPFISIFRKKAHTHSLLIPNSILISGIALMVATMSELNPRITLLTPVLQSPLLSIHVMMIMISYALFALITLNAIVNLIKKNRNTQFPTLTFALFLLTAGIFIGAIWANRSWGRYWGWDPKEVWALITMLIYSLPLHRVSLKIFQNPRFLNWYYILAFLSVIITYFGVNFILGGLHSYA